MPSPVTFLRQISGKEGWKSASMKWAAEDNSSYYSGSCDFGYDNAGFKQMEGFHDMYSGENGGGFMMRKRVMVVVDQSSHSKHAMLWALTHVANKGDMLTLLHIIPPNQSLDSVPSTSSACSPYLASSLGSLCKACKPEVEVEALVIQGPKMATVMNQVKKLEVSVLVLGQKQPSSLLLNCFCVASSLEEFVEECINTVDCLTIGVRKQSKGMGGYLISTRWQKNFWLLA